MAEAERIPDNTPDNSLEMEGFDQFFSDNFSSEETTITISGEATNNKQLEQLIDRLSELITLSVDQRMETSKLSQQLSENQRQLIATQQILIKLMEKSLELTRHVTTLEDRLTGVYELPRIVESLRERVAQLEGVELR
tara:strand:- start:327 stop:740 length:414 start_codon:yes stop_codon:yes gene_type:complete